MREFLFPESFCCSWCRQSEEGPSVAVLEVKNAAQVKPQRRGESQKRLYFQFPKPWTHHLGNLTGKTGLLSWWGSQFRRKITCSSWWRISVWFVSWFYLFWKKMALIRNFKRCLYCNWSKHDQFDWAQDEQYIIHNIWGNFFPATSWG